MAKFSLDEILEDPEYLKFAAELTGPGKPNADQARLEEGFVQVLAFFENHSRLPAQDSDEFAEQSLAARFASIIENNENVALVRHLDHLNILPKHFEEDAQVDISLDDMLGDEMFDGTDAIFDLVNIKPRAEIEPADFRAGRKPCKDFDKFKPIFDVVATELKTGIRKSVRFKNEQEIEVGHFFIYRGAMVYVADKGREETKNGKKNARLRLIFDNGTEGNNLLRSLARELYKDPHGRRVTQLETGGLFKDIESEIQTGTIYVLKSRSDNPEIRQYDGILHKIGVTSLDVEKRISGADSSSTFLLDKVEIVATYDLVNINRHKLEKMLHTFFAEAKADIVIPDRFGKPVSPREWFFVTIGAINAAIEAIRSNNIANMRYDVTSAQVINRRPS